MLEGAVLEGGILSLAKIGRLVLRWQRPRVLRWQRPLGGTPKTVTISNEADGGYACCACADVPTAPLCR